MSDATEYADWLERQLAAPPCACGGPCEHDGSLAEAFREQQRLHEADPDVFPPPPAAVPDPRFRDQLAEAPTWRTELWNRLSDLLGQHGPTIDSIDDDEHDDLLTAFIDGLERDVLPKVCPTLPIAAEVEARVQAAANQRAVEMEKALRLIDRYDCEHYTRGRCLDPTSSKTRGAQNGADAWCAPCVAAAALASTAPGTDVDRG